MTMKTTTKMVLEGIKVIEFAGLAPAPFCGKILTDFGASVIRIDKHSPAVTNWLDNNKRSIILDVKKSSAVDVVKKMCHEYDVIIDPYRPGVLEKLGLGPSDLMSINPSLVYARLSGYGQNGPLSKVAGHDINYVALSGVLSMLGRKETKPTPPINLLADFAGGGLLCALGIVMSLYGRTQSGSGQVVDLSMAEGAAYVASWLYSSQDSYLWSKPKGENILDSGAHFYDTYETKDGKFMAVGSIESQFYERLLKGLQLEDISHMDDFEENKVEISKRFKEKTQLQWIQIFEHLDACVMPVLSTKEAPLHPHNEARNNFRKVKDHLEPTAAPRFTDMFGNLSHTSKQQMKDHPPCPVAAGEHTVQVLSELGYSTADIDSLLRQGAAQTINSKL